MTKTCDPQRPWMMMTWANGDGTGAITMRYYINQRDAVRAADRLRARGIVAMVERCAERAK